MSENDNSQSNEEPQPQRPSDLIDKRSSINSEDNNNKSLEMQDITLNSTGVENKDQINPASQQSPFPQKAESSPEQPQGKTLDTLDESISQTLKRDCFRIFNKLKHVIVPRFSAQKYEELQNWDLWGPLVFCFALGIALSTGEHEEEEGSVFIIIFAIFWFGGVIISFNASFLGGKIGICQMICLLGYCIFPIVIGSILIACLSISQVLIKLIIVSVGFVWSCLASVGFVSGLVEQERKMVAVLPVFLFYLSISLFVLNY